MRRPRPRSRLTADDVAIPKLDLTAELIEGIGLAGAALLPQEPIPPPRGQRRQPAAGAEAGTAGQQGEQRSGLPRVLMFPRIDDDPPLGPSPDNPMGEGPEDTAVPVIDPVEVRLGRERLAGEPDERD
jgi:hypothetical protein